jgi:TorA maturation chaperone TorD
VSQVAERLAMSRAYGLLGRMFLRGADAISRERASEVPWLASLLTDIDSDEVAARHHRCFHLEAFPYAGVFLGEDSGAGGVTADEMTERYAASGFRPRLTEVTADHLGIALAFLSFVTAAAAEAREDRRESIAISLEQQSAAFIDLYLTSWLPVLDAALGEQSDVLAPWPELVSVTLALIETHRAELTGARTAVESAAVEFSLDDARTDLRAIADHLSNPGACGLFLTRHNLHLLGRGTNLPRGFGSRSLEVTNLLRSASEYGALPDLCDALDRVIDDRCERMKHEFAAGWHERLNSTRRLLGTIRHHANSL